MVANRIIKGISNGRDSNEVTNKSNAKGHDQDNQKLGTKGNSKGSANMEDNEIKGFPEKKDP